MTLTQNEEWAKNNPTKAVTDASFIALGHQDYVKAIELGMLTDHELRTLMSVIGDYNTANSMVTTVDASCTEENINSMIEATGKTIDLAFYELEVAGNIAATGVSGDNVNKLAAFWPSFINDIADGVLWILGVDAETDVRDMRTKAGIVACNETTDIEIHA